MLPLIENSFKNALRNALFSRPKSSFGEHKFWENREKAGLSKMGMSWLCWSHLIYFWLEMHSNACFGRQCTFFLKCLVNGTRPFGRMMMNVYVSSNQPISIRSCSEMAMTDRKMEWVPLSMSCLHWFIRWHFHGE
jgi:hypothetical protein